ncbi:hypothetical protein GNI_011800 [Gregarina niphandrodes]|uniref:Uncharacterized protein n=1 Tax=Gregarina niphandrodes TaxID=110365 RepID=A0A023BD04_GRENI|nr:hypothetical protein GNI_011800 [Gregarina niphandrodes]EZG85435.1 hypothetical protein GNI_011800 [Gregarina niphandrodes]|eukprot:XP_011128831.1 hypothetical protein GNI_011800 [Gregarina niphandrodes]
MSDFEYEDDDYGYEEDGAGVADLFTEAEFVGLRSPAAHVLLRRVLETATEADTSTLKKALLALLCHPLTTLDAAVDLVNRLHAVGGDMDRANLNKGISQLVRLGGGLALLKAQPWCRGDLMRLTLVTWAEYNLNTTTTRSIDGAPANVGSSTDGPSTNKCQLGRELKECEDELYDWVLAAVNKPPGATPVCSALYIILQIHHQWVAENYQIGENGAGERGFVEADSFPLDQRCKRILDYLQRTPDVNTVLDMFVKTFVVNLALIDYCILTDSFDRAWDLTVDLLAIANNQVQHTTCHAELYKRVLVLEILAPRDIDINTLCNLGTHGTLAAVESRPAFRHLLDLVNNKALVQDWNPSQQILVKVRKFAIRRSR